MAQTTRISCPPAETDGIVAKTAGLPGVLSLAVLSGAARHPPGDVIVIESTSDAHVQLTRSLEATLRRRPEIVLSIADLITIVSAGGSTLMQKESSEVGWEEMDALLNQESNMSGNTLFTMGLAGFVAAAGIASGALHLVIGASIISPAYEPISRFALSLVARSRTWRASLRHIATGYAALFAGGALAAAAHTILRGTPLASQGAYESTAAMVSYWSSLRAFSFVADFMAGFAGAILVASHRSILTAGVLVAISLVPSMSLVPLALAAGLPGVAVSAFYAWLLNLIVVAGTSAIVFGWKRFHVHKRSMIG